MVHLLFLLCQADPPPVHPAEAYSAAYDRAVAEGKLLYVFVGQPAREVSNALSVRWDRCPGASSPSVVVGKPDGIGGMDREDRPGMFEQCPPAVIHYPAPTRYVPAPVVRPLPTGEFPQLRPVVPFRPIQAFVPPPRQAPVQSFVAPSFAPPACLT